MNINQLIEQLAEKFADEHLHANQETFKEDDWDVSESEFVIGTGEEQLDYYLDELVISEIKRLAKEKYAELCKATYGKVQYHKHGS